MKEKGQWARISLSKFCCGISALCNPNPLEYLWAKCQLFIKEQIPGELNRPSDDDGWRVYREGVSRGQWGIDLNSVNSMFQPPGLLSVHSPSATRLITAFTCGCREVCVNNLVILIIWKLGICRKGLGSIVHYTVLLGLHCQIHSTDYYWECTNSMLILTHKHADVTLYILIIAQVLVVHWFLLFLTNFFICTHSS